MQFLTVKKNIFVYRNYGTTGVFHCASFAINFEKKKSTATARVSYSRLYSSNAIMVTKLKKSFFSNNPMKPKLVLNEAQLNNLVVPLSN